MPSAEGPLLPRRRLGAELRKLRAKRTLEEVYQATLISTSKLSRLENGQGAPQQRDIRDLINYYNVDKPTADRIRRWTAEGRKQAWWKEYSDVVPGPLDAYLDFESGASVMRSYGPLIPGLLQTGAYARHALAALPPPRTPDQIEKLVELRLRRQDLLHANSGSTQLSALIDESALWRMPGTPEDARGQLKHLLQVSKRRNISLRIIPFDAGLHPGLLGMFTVFQFADDIDRDIVSVESYSGDRYLEEQGSVLEYLRTFDTLTHIAHDHDDSRDLLEKIMSSLPTPKETS